MRRFIEIAYVQIIEYLSKKVLLRIFEFLKLDLITLCKYMWEQGDEFAVSVQLPYLCW